MPTLPNRYKYLESLARELQSQSHRVRDLIGDRHWLTDGHHKEYLLLELLKRHLPTGLLPGRGFVVSAVDDSVCSSEQDILIIDQRHEAPVFHQSHVMIAFPTQVVAAISVKTTMAKDTIKDAVEGLHTVRSVTAGEQAAERIWCGAFFFETASPLVSTPAKILEYLNTILPGLSKIPSQAQAIACPIGPDLIAAGDDLCVILDHSSDPTTVRPPEIRAYQCGKMSPAMFLAHLLDHTAFACGAHHSSFADFANIGEFPRVSPQAARNS